MSYNLNEVVNNIEDREVRNYMNEMVGQMEVFSSQEKNCETKFLELFFDELIDIGFSWERAENVIANAQVNFSRSLTNNDLRCIAKIYAVMAEKLEKVLDQMSDHKGVISAIKKSSMNITVGF